MKIVLVIIAVLCAGIVLFGFDTGELGPMKVLAAGLICAAVAHVAP